MDQTKALKFAVLGFNYSPVRYELLSAWLTEKSVPHTFECLQVSPTEFESQFEPALKKFDQIRIETPHGMSAYKHFKSHEALMSKLRSVDCVFQDNLKHWWCRSLTYRCLTEAFQKVGEQVDLDKSVMVVGAGSSARAAVAACAKMGFKSFKITNKYDDQGLELIREMKTNFFGLNFEFVPQNRLTLLPGSNCIAINTTPNDPSNDLLKELYYFNFLKKNGIVVDLTFEPLTTQLIRESLEIKNTVIYGYELAAISDAIWLEWVLGQPQDRESLRKHYEVQLIKRAKASTKDEKLK